MGEDFWRDIEDGAFDVGDAFGGVEKHGIAKIDKLYLTLLVYYYVVHFNVAVTDITFMAVVDGEEELFDDSWGILFGETLTGADDVNHISPITQLRHQQKVILIPIHLNQSHYVRVVQLF